MSTSAPEAPAERGALLRRVSDAAWRLLVIGAAILAILWVLDKLRLVLLALYFALLIAAAVVPIVRRLEERGTPTLAATWIGFGGLLVLIGGTIALLVPVIIDEFEDLPSVIEQGIDDIEDWLVDGPAGLDRGQITDFRDTFNERVGNFFQDSSEEVWAGAVVVFEGIAATVLAIVLSFFLIKDGRRFQRWAMNRLPERHHDQSAALARSAWGALGGYLRGAALLGVVEAIVLGTALWLAGATLIVPVMVLTFAGAFVPLVGAVVAGIIAVLVALVSSGFEAALVIAVVAVIVQQFDSDLLAPWIYGKQLSLHPAIVLLAIASGSLIAGVTGTFLAVPVAAVIASTYSELWSRHGEAWRARA